MPSVLCLAPSIHPPTTRGAHAKWWHVSQFCDLRVLCRQGAFPDIEVPKVGRVQTNDGVHEAPSWPAVGFDELSQHWWVVCRFSVVSAGIQEGITPQEAALALVQHLWLGSKVHPHSSSCLTMAPFAICPCSVAHGLLTPRWPPCHPPQHACSGRSSCLQWRQLQAF